MRKRKYARRKSQVATIEQKMVWSGSATLILLFGLYGYFLSGTVLHVVSQKNLADRRTAVVAEVSDLEYQYTSLSSGLDLAYAQSLGFQRVESPRYTKQANDLAMAVQR